MLRGSRGEGPDPTSTSFKFPQGSKVVKTPPTKKKNNNQETVKNANPHHFIEGWMGPSRIQDVDPLILNWSSGAPKG